MSLPPIRVQYPCIEVRDDLLGGSPVIRGTRIPVRRIWAWHRKGVSVETLVKRYASVGWEKVCGAIAFGYANEDVLEADLARERALIDADLPPPEQPSLSDQQGPGPVKALDLYCCAGGASDGLVRAGFSVHGFDVEPQPEYPHNFTQADVGLLHHGYLASFDFVWASPPCQAFTAYKRRAGHVREALNLIPQTRELLSAAGVPYVIENVPGAPLENPITLCGSMFGLDVRRHRIFETSFPVTPPPCRHELQTPCRFPGATNRAKNSRATVEVGVYRIPVETQRKAMGVDRPVSLGKLSQMVPPAFAEWLGLQARAHIMTQRRAA